MREYLKKMSATADATCLLCQAWVRTSCEKAFTAGLHIPAADAHNTLILGFSLALVSATSGKRPTLCGVHEQQVEGWVRAVAENNGNVAETINRLARERSSGGEVPS